MDIGDQVVNIGVSSIPVGTLGRIVQFGRKYDYSVDFGEWYKTWWVRGYEVEQFVPEIFAADLEDSLAAQIIGDNIHNEFF